ncbi:MAG: serine hydrolase domain-containing protein, partial [Oricola sp.]
RLDAVIDRWVESEKIVGAVALVARDGEIVYRRAAGMADRENGIPVTEETIFRHASNTKAIVSAVALRLIEEGKLSLDDRVTDWLPWFAPRLEDGRRPEISIRQLMTHTSGLSYSFFEPEGNAYIAGGVPQGIEAGTTTLEEALRKLAAAPLFYEPGTEWRYSLSTDVLGAVVEKAAGMRLEDAVKRYVTGPLAMTSTTFHVTDAKRLAAAYRDGKSRAIRMNDRLDYLPLGTGGPVAPARALDPDAYPSGGGGMSGTADEYLRFLEVLRKGGGPLLSNESVTALTSHQIGGLRAWTEGEGWGFGLGVAVLLDPEAAQTPQGKGTWQWGGALGSHWFVDPENKLTVVVLTNTAVAGVIGAFPAAIRDAVYGVESDHDS